MGSFFSCFSLSLYLFNLHGFFHGGFQTPAGSVPGGGYGGDEVCLGEIRGGEEQHQCSGSV